MPENLYIRENNILRLAHGFLSSGRGLPADAKIDAEFLFRYEFGWCRWVSRIREMAGSLCGKNGCELLESEEAARLWVHLEGNAGLEVSVNIAPDSTHPMIGTPRGSYHVFNRELKSKQEREALEAVKTGDTTELEKVSWEIWGEANQTHKILDELWRLACTYRLVPATDREAAQFAPTKIQEQYRAVVNWVLWGQSAPTFLYPVVLLAENPTGEGVVRIVRPHPWEGSLLPAENFGIRPETRVRTWSVYYLTRRGGGRLSEQEAVTLWDREFVDSLTERNFRSERQRLFSHLSKSG